MRSGQGNLDGYLGGILRALAKIVGCNSANLVLMNANTRDIRVHIGAGALNAPMVSMIEAMLGGGLGSITVPIKKAHDSLVHRSWKDRSILETSSLAELAGSAFAPRIATAIGSIVGRRRFICIPTLSGNRSYGVLVLEKPGEHPFSQQHRELLLRYGRSIGELVENNLLRLGQALFSQPAPADLDDQPCPVCRGHGPAHDRASKGSLESQLLRLTVDDPAAVVFVDSALRITSSNDAVQRLFGYPAAELTDQRIGLLFRDSQQIHDLLQHRIRDPLTFDHRESITARRRDGTFFSSHVKALRLADERGRLEGLLVLVREEPEATVDAQRPLLQERLATMGEMAAQLAHEIRNPLVAIGANIESLARDEEEEGKRSLLRVLVTEINRMDMILKGYMAGRSHDLTFSNVRLVDVVAEARQLLAGAHRFAGKRITVAVDAALTVRANGDALKHVFFNLMLNALEASPPDGEVLCTGRAGEKDISVSIVDQGTGLRTSAAECLRPFFTTKKNGTGLGLAVCQKIIRAHGGLIELRNGAESGCEAVVVLPPGERAPAPLRSMA